MYPGLPAALPDWLRTHHSMRVTAELLTLEMSPVSTISKRVLEGQVNVDANASESTRSGTCVLLDPEHQLHFDSDSPADGALFADRLIRLHYGIRHPGGKWVDVPILTGPVTKFDRDGARVNVEVQGKERLARGAAWRVKTYKKGTRKSAVIRDLLEQTGERHFGFTADERNAKLGSNLTLHHESVPWEVAKKLALSMGLHLYYDGRGRCQLRGHPGTSLWTFNDGDGGEVMTAPKVSFDISGVKNAVRVVGKKPKGAKTKVKGVAVADPQHPLSPARLGRNSEGLFLGEFIDDSSIGTDAEAHRVAEARLKTLLLELVDVAFDSRVIPHLDEGDLVTVKTSEFTMGTRLTKFSIPLTASGTMSVGYLKRIKPKRKRIR